MSTITVIPDIHADPIRLANTLDKVGFSEQIAFLGDFIDAGDAVAKPDDAKTLQQVRSLIEDGDAVAVMGNHELNAILFHSFDRQGNPLRSHDDKNKKQHRSFCKQFGIATPEALEWTSWFLTLPLWQDLDGLRLVHACWSAAHIAIIAERRPDGCLWHEDLSEVAANKTPFARAVNILISGPEARLPDGYGFHDFGGHFRDHARIAWWRANARTWREAALSVPDPNELPEHDMGQDASVEFYPEELPPVLVGHYKMAGSPMLESGRAACLDYPMTPCAYRWAGETRLETRHLVIV